MEGGDPLGAVFSPDEYTVTVPDAALCKECGKAACKTSQFAVGCYSASVPLVANNCYLAVVAAEVVKQCG